MHLSQQAFASNNKSPPVVGGLGPIDGGDLQDAQQLLAVTGAEGGLRHHRDRFADPLQALLLHHLRHMCRRGWRFTPFMLLLAEKGTSGHQMWAH